MAFCRFCGKQIPDDAAFCVACGKPTGYVASGAPVPAASPSSPQPTAVPVSLLAAKEIVMNKKILSLTEHYDFQDRDGNRLGEGDGNFFQFPAKFVVRGANGEELMHLNGKLISLRKEFDMYDPSSNLLGAIKKKLVKLIGSEYWVEKDKVQFMRVYGNFTEHDYRMEVNGTPVAQVHMAWVSIRDQFGISITGDVDPRLVIGAVIAIEHEEVTEQNQGMR
jgi:uncharacterized protein YxjI